jgi:hypothetical protein
MKSFSALNILGGRLSNDYEPQSFFKYLLNRKSITIEIPYYEYLRGKIVLSDLRDLYGEDVPYNFDIAGLIYILYDDFLRQVKSGSSSPEVIAKFLSDRKKLYFPQVEERRVMKAISTTLFEFQTEEVEVEEENQGKTAYIEMKIAESKVLRGEVLLYDLSTYLEGEEITVEELFAINYLNFIKKIIEKGNTTNALKAIVQYLNSTN